MRFGHERRIASIALWYRQYAVAENHAIVGWETVLGGAIAADRPQMAPSRTAPITFDNNFILSAPF
jgi:hypothetical protein